MGKGLSSARIMRSLVASSAVISIAVLPSTAASALQRQVAEGSARCLFSGTVRFSPPLGTSNGGSNSSRITGVVTNCTNNSGIVTRFATSHLTGTFASSPFACASSFQTNAVFSGSLKWTARTFPSGGLVSTVLDSGTANGSFAGAGVVSLQVPAAISGGCGGKGIARASVSGTVTVGQACGRVADPISLYAVVPPICGSTNLEPTSMTTGPDGALWFLTDQADLIGRTTTTGQTTFYPAPLGSENTWGNGGITSGPDGALWFVVNGTSIGRMTTAGSVITYPVPSSVFWVSSITSGPDGALWFTANSNSGNSIGRITTSGHVTLFQSPSLGTANWNMSNHQDLVDITNGPDGALWFSSENLNGQNGGSSPTWIGTMTTSGAVTEYPVPFAANAGPLTTGPDGALWFGTTLGGAIGRVTTSGQFTEFTGQLTQIGDVTGITVGSDGALWFVNDNQVGPVPMDLPTIGRITTDGTLSTYTDSAIEGAVSIASGSDGGVWFLDHTNDAVGRVSTP